MNTDIGGHGVIAKRRLVNDMGVLAWFETMKRLSEVRARYEGSGAQPAMAIARKPRGWGREARHARVRAPEDESRLAMLA
jgi:hypothetical protein